MKHDELADALAVLRIRAGLTQPSLSDKLGLQVNLVQKIESGEREPSFALMADWARLCGSDLDVRFRQAGQEDNEDAAGQYAKMILALPPDDQLLIRSLLTQLNSSSTGWRDILKEQLNFRVETRTPPSSTPAAVPRSTPAPAPSRGATPSPVPRSTPQVLGGRAGTPAGIQRAVRGVTPAPQPDRLTATHSPLPPSATPRPIPNSATTARSAPTRRALSSPAPLTLPSTFPNLRSSESIADDGSHIPSDNELAEREMGDRLRAVARQNADDLPVPVEGATGFSEVIAVLKRTLRSRFPWMFGT